MKRLNQKLQRLPQKPGVYKFLDQTGQVIYIGKAKNLRTRVRQYFGGKDERPQIPYLLNEIANVDYTIVNNELESLYLENTLIKHYHPKYNIELKDDKNYAFIKIDYSTEIPQIVITRKIEQLLPRPPLMRGGKKGGVYFGPYTATYKIRETLHLIRKIFSFCGAKKVSQKPCFYFHLHHCPGVCIGKISLLDYLRHLEMIKMFLAGKIEKVAKEIKSEMHKKARAKKFEAAARLRDQLRALEMLQTKQTMILPKKVDWDVVSLAFNDKYACVNLFKVRGGKLLDKENFVYELTDITSHPPLILRGGEGEILQAFLENYYLETSSIPKEIYLQNKIENVESVQKLIFSRFSKNVKISVPQRGKPKHLVKLGQTNAQEYLKNWLADKAGQMDRTNSALNELKTLLNLPSIPRRIEAYDISNIQGTNAVGSMVIFLDGLPAKAQYRKFRIKTKATPDDFAMMREMISRRFAHSANGAKFETRNSKLKTIHKSQNQNSKPWELPDLIVIDGGKGQLNAALEALRKTQEPKRKIQIIGLAKKLEEIYVPGKKEPIRLSADNPALQLLQRLRDEAHRFAVTFHRKLRSKGAVKSALDEIPGIGPKTKKLLKEKFGTAANIRKANLNDLIETVGTKTARLIKQLL